MEKFRIINGAQVIEFDTREEFDTYISSITPPEDAVLTLSLQKSQEHEVLGKSVIRDLYVTLRAQNLTSAQEDDLLNRVFSVFCYLGFGFIRGARVRANGLTVAGQLTQVRKDYLLSKIDAAILLL